MTDSANSNTDRSAAALNSPGAIRDGYVELGGPIELDEISIRSAMSEFTTGVTIIVTEDRGGAYGFTCQSFSSLSLTPPTVLFTVMKTSRSWPHVWNAGRFSINVLAEDREDISTVFGRSNGKKFKMGKRIHSGLGNPLLHGCPAWIDCTIVDVYEGGDHWIVTAGIVTTDEREEINPSTYRRGSYARVSHPGTDAPVDQR